MFIPASALLAMHSTYIGQLMQPAAASLIVRMCIHLGGVAIVYAYLHHAMCLSTQHVLLLWFSHTLELLRGLLNEPFLAL